MGHMAYLEIVRKYDNIFVEDLTVTKMLKNRRLSRSIGDASWRMFRQMLEYKVKFYGKVFLSVDPRDTTKTCHECDYVLTNPLPLSQRKWLCPECDVIHDRDVNAALNILKAGQALCGAQVRPVGPSGSNRRRALKRKPLRAA
jgi:putative transposase